MEPNLKKQTIRAAKWNLLDKVASQVLYALTGLVLANLLNKEQFGLVGTLLVFQAFASLFVDSGFASALIQRKTPTERDYSTVFWFNMLMAVSIYALLFLLMPLIAEYFQNATQLVPLGRIMFLTFILNAAGIVQTNRMVKQMNVRPVAIANCTGLLIGSIAGIWLAFTLRDARALVWQYVITAGCKSLLLWILVRWTPQLILSWQILRSFFSIGSGVMLQSFFNILFQNIYSIVIGHRLGMIPLGVYTQADKWSKMPSASLSQVLTSSFLPPLSAVQDQSERFTNMSRTIHRNTGLILLPGFTLIIIIAAPIFHLCFQHKWDAAIPLFQLLMLRSIPIVLSGLYCNFILAKGRARLLAGNEIIRDSVAFIALIATLPLLSRPDGIALMLYGQIAAAVITVLVTAVQCSRVVNRSVLRLLSDLLPGVLLATLLLLPAYFFSAKFGLF